MHEMTVAQSILDLIQQEMDRHPGAKLLAFDIEVGELSCVQEHSLRFCLEATLQQARWSGAQVRIRNEPIQAHCNACDRAFTPVRYEFICPHCRGADVRIVGGQEVRLKSLEIDT